MPKSSIATCTPSVADVGEHRPGRGVGKQRSNETHASTTDSEVRLHKKAEEQAAKLSHMGHVVMENRSGLVVAA